MIRRGNASKQTSVTNAPIQNDTLTGREGVVKASAPENLNAVYESTNFEVDLSGQLTTRKALRPCPYEFRSGIQLFDGYVLTKYPATGNYGIEKNGAPLGIGAGLVYVTYVDYETSEEAPEVALDSIKDALILDYAKCETSGSIAYLSTVVVDTSAWTLSTKPFSSDVSSEIVRLATLRKDEGSETKWILRIITPEVAVPEAASDGNGFDPNLYGDNPYAMRDAYGYGSTAVRGILAYKAKSLLADKPDDIAYTFPLNGSNPMFHCVAGTKYLYIYANHAMSRCMPSQLRAGTHHESRLWITFDATYADGKLPASVTHKAPMLYVPKGALLARVPLTNANSSGLSNVKATVSGSDSSTNAVWLIPDDRDFAECPNSEAYSAAPSSEGSIIATAPTGDEGWDAEYTLERFGLSVSATVSTCTVEHRVPSLYKDTRGYDTLTVTTKSASGASQSAAIERYADNANAVLKLYDTCTVSASVSDSWAYAYYYAQNTSVQDLMEFSQKSGCGMISSIRAADFSDADDVLVLKALMTFSDTPKERYIYWERSMDGVNWESVPEFLLRMSRPGTLRYIRVTDAASSNETLESADSYAKYVLACPVPASMAQSDKILSRPDVLVIPQKNVAAATLYKYRVTCVERAALADLTPTDNAKYPTALYRAFSDDATMRVPCYKEGPVVYMDSEFPSAELSLRYTRGLNNGTATYAATGSSMGEAPDLSKSPVMGVRSATRTLTLDASDFTRTSRLFAVRQTDSHTYAQTLEATIMRCTPNVLTLNEAPVLNANCKGASTGGSTTLSYAYSATLRNRTDFPVYVCNISWVGEGVSFASYTASDDEYGFGEATYSVSEPYSYATGTSITFSAAGTSDSAQVTFQHTFNSHTSSPYYGRIDPIYYFEASEISKYGRLFCRAGEEGGIALSCTASYKVGEGKDSETLTVDAQTLNYAVKDTVVVNVRGCAYAMLTIADIPRSASSEYYKSYAPGKALRRISIWQPTQTSVAFGPYTFDLATKTEALSTSSLNIGMCNILEHNEVFLAYGGDAKNKVYVSEAGTMVFPNSLAIESRSGADVTGLLKWRSHIIMTTKSSIELLTYDSETGTYAMRTLSATMGVSEDDANALQALPNSFILRSGSAVYSMSPSIYSGSDELLYTNLISAKLGDTLSDKPAVCSWLDRSANTYHMLCKGNVDYVYDYTRKIWWRNVYTPSVKGVSYISGDPYLACAFTDATFGTVLYKYDTSLYSSGDGRYVDTYWEGTDASPRLVEARIPLSVTWRDRCSKPTLDKQWLELKYTVARHNGLKHISDECSIGVGGETLTRTLDPNASMPFATSEDAYINGLGALSANAFQTDGKTAGGNMDQMFVKFSGRGKTATLTIEPTSDDRITLHSAELRWRTLPNKQ